MQVSIPQSMFGRKGQIVSACIVTAALISVGSVLRVVALYPRTDDAEVTANFIGIAPVVEGPVVQLPIHDNDFVKKGDLLYRIDDRPYLYALQNAVAAQAELEGEIENESRRISSQVNSVDVANAGEQSALANEPGQLTKSRWRKQRSRGRKPHSSKRRPTKVTQRAIFIG